MTSPTAALEHPPPEMVSAPRGQARGHRTEVRRDAAHIRPRADCGPILVVESDPDLAGALVEQLAADGYPAQLALTAEHARILAGESSPKLAVLGDFDSPRGALELLEEIRASDRANGPWVPGLPAIVMGSRAQELAVLRAFEAGADDFLVRPARYLELRARLRAILRRAEGLGAGGGLLAIGPLAINPSARLVSLCGQPVDLRRMEFELLLHLAGDPERAFTKDELLRAVWGYRSRGSTRTVDSHASRLRRALDADGSGRWVINVWGVGYRLR